MGQYSGIDLDGSRHTRIGCLREKGSNHSFGLNCGSEFRYGAVMPRKIRVEYLGGIYHVMSQGDRSENIFLDDVDQRDFPNPKTRRNTKNFRQPFLLARRGPERLRALINSKRPAVLDLEE